MMTRWIIGLASGSGADSVDAALLEVAGVGLELEVQPLQTYRLAYPRDLRSMVLQISAKNATDLRQISLLHRLLGETFATAACQVAQRASLGLQKVHCLGCSGQALWHEPEARFPSTFDLGMAAVIAERTGITVISDFRSRDMAAGGQGVLLTALADHLLFHDLQENRVLLHLGGIARLVYLPASGRTHQITGFEAGPGTLFLNELTRQLTGGRETSDPGGKLAVQGRCLEPLLERWLGHSFFQRRPPKSFPRTAGVEEWAAQAVAVARQQNSNLYDVLCTAHHLVAHALVDALRRFLPGSRLDRILLSGSGVRNGFLLHLLDQLLAGIPVEKTDTLGIPALSTKAVTYGLLAALTLDGVPANVPSATGAIGGRLLGSLTPGMSANWARCISWMAAQNPPYTALSA
jgi:anhydro-N-acetylmuramic acid kinase